jgi:hypothetical protein
LVKSKHLTTFKRFSPSESCGPGVGRGDEIGEHRGKMLRTDYRSAQKLPMTSWQNQPTMGAIFEPGDLAGYFP